MRGMGRIFKRGDTFWIAYNHRGKEFRESSHSSNERVASKLLKKRIIESGRGRVIGPSEERVTFDGMAADLENYYRINRKRSLKSLPYWLKHLRDAFSGWRAIDITADHVRGYVAKRLAGEPPPSKVKKATPATVNRELTALKRMFSLAVRDHGRLMSAPYIKLLEENNARQGFVEPGDFARLRAALPAYLQDPVGFLYHSAWRKGEMRSLEWRDVDLDGRAIRLRPENSKTNQGRVLILAHELLAIIERARDKRRLDCPFVFHDDGQPIGDFRKAWRNACKAAGLEGLVVHDLRRSGVRNMIRAGTPERVAMARSGHKTRAMLDRYNITSEEDLRLSAERTGAYVEEHQTVEEHKTAKVTPITTGRAA